MQKNTASIPRLFLAFGILLLLFTVTAPEQALAAEDSYQIVYSDYYVTMTGLPTDNIQYVVLTSRQTSCSISRMKTAYYNPETRLFYLDFCDAKTNKDFYIGYVRNYSATEKQVRFDEIININASFKRIQPLAEFDCARDLPLSQMRLERFIKRVTVTYADGTKKLYNRDEKGLFSDLELQYKRGTDGMWKEAVAFSSIQLNSLLNYGGTLYLRAKAKDDNTAGYGYSPVAKIKFAMPAKAPNIKVDVSKGTIAVKNGQEISANGRNWVKILPYDSDSTNQDIYSTSAEATIIKIPSMSAEALVERLSLSGYNNEYTMYVRVSATSAKPPSLTATVRFKGLKTIQTGGVAVVRPGENTTGITLPAINTGSSEAPKLEYIIIDPADLDRIDFVKTKWVGAGSTEIKVSKNTGGPYYVTGEKKAKTEVIEAGKTLLLVRERASADTMASRRIVITTISGTTT